MPEEEKPSELYPRVAECERSLNELIQDIINVGEKVRFVAQESSAVSIFLEGALNRSRIIIDAILVLTSSWNFGGASLLVRPHLDTLLRLSYLKTAKNRDDFCRQILNGEPANKIKDEEGERLKDVRLRDYARSIFPEVDDVYSEFSKFIHFSDRHLRTSIEVVDEAGGSRVISTGEPLSKSIDESIVYLLDRTIEITEAILAVIKELILQEA